MSSKNTITPFQINITEERISLLQQKLALSILPDELEDAGRDYGVPLADIQRLLARWQSGYDWKKHEKELNQELPQFQTDIDIEGHGTLKIHFVHKKSNVEGAIPLLFVHGWPGSVVEVRKILPLLIQGSPAFHVVALGLPGYGFSEAPKKKGFAFDQYAEVGNKLMIALGYDQYVTQGGDWGYMVTRRIAHLYGGTHCKAWHTNYEAAEPGRVPPELFSQPAEFFKNLSPDITPEEKSGLERSVWFRTQGMGYFMEQSTQPQTIGYSLADSPVGLLAWIYEKLVNWTDNYPWDDDEVLTWVSIYWFSNAGPAASARIYYESVREAPTANPLPTIPHGASVFPKDIFVAPLSWTKSPHRVFETAHNKGGHFAALESPEVLVGDLRKMFAQGGPAYGVVEGRISDAIPSSLKVTKLQLTIHAKHKPFFLVPTSPKVEAWSFSLKWLQVAATQGFQTSTISGGLPSYTAVKNQMNAVTKPFQISVPDKSLELLNKKLALSILPDELEDAGRDYGAPLSDIQRLLARWKSGYDWRRYEKQINSELPQFQTEIDVNGHGTLKIHFVHKKSEVEGAIPLLFVHGWPGSVVEVRKILPLLIKGGPDQPSFHVVALSLPGFGFSEAPRKRGFAFDQYAEVGNKLMLALGYDQYVTQGGDWGYMVTRRIGHLYGRNYSRAWHTNYEAAEPGRVPAELFSKTDEFLKNLGPEYTAADKAGLERTVWYRNQGMGYFSEQATQPQTIGYSLADSPVGLLAWIYEKLVNWTDDYSWDDDEVLTWVSIYWFSTAGPVASVRIYYENRHEKPYIDILPTIPHGASVFPKDIFVAPLSWTESPYRVFATVHPRGGHFAATEQPERLVEDVRRMFAKKGPAFGVVEGRIGY
uniref:Epoxide hydrolase N-terminal domain-containing protein n=1 Tax=Psilocybe cubensis TaxID=181762 RepID=A0A8H7XQQ2_PSICU